MSVARLSAPVANSGPERIWQLFDRARTGSDDVGIEIGRLVHALPATTSHVAASDRRSMS